MKGKYLLTILILSFAALGFKCGGGNGSGDNFKPNKAELGENWSQFKHDSSFGAWVFKEENRPQEHRTPQGSRVFWNGAVTAEELNLVDSGLTEMLSMCRRDTVNWQPANLWTKFAYFQTPSAFKTILVPSNYTLQEGEAAGCAGIITGAGGVYTAAGTVGGIVIINGLPASKGGIYIIVPKQTPEQFARPECKNLMKNAIGNEAEHIWMTNSPQLYFSFANDGELGNHPYCRGNESL